MSSQLPEKPTKPGMCTHKAWIYFIATFHQMLAAIGCGAAIRWLIMSSEIGQNGQDLHLFGVYIMTVTVGNQVPVKGLLVMQLTLSLIVILVDSWLYGDYREKKKDTTTLLKTGFASAAVFSVVDVLSLAVLICVIESVPFQVVLSIALIAVVPIQIFFVDQVNLYVKKLKKEIDESAPSDPALTLNSV